MFCYFYLPFVLLVNTKIQYFKKLFPERDILAILIKMIDIYKLYIRLFMLKPRKCTSPADNCRNNAVGATMFLKWLAIIYRKKLAPHARTSESEK